MKNKYIDSNFKPFILELEKFSADVKDSGKQNLLEIALEKPNGSIYKKEFYVYMDNVNDDMNIYIVKKIVNAILYIIGGYKLYIYGSEIIYNAIKDSYLESHENEFTRVFMTKIYGQEFTIINSKIKEEKETVIKIEESFYGNRIGIDLGGSDIKISLIRNGCVISTKEIKWNPKTSLSLDYHKKILKDVLFDAANTLSEIDSIGISSAGVIVNNRPMISSLFLNLRDDDLKESKNIFIDLISKLEEKLNIKISFKVVNDGDAAALGGAFSHNLSNCLAIAMGTSEASGYVDKNRNLKEYISELAFVEIDSSKDAVIDEWSHIKGTGSKYLSQDAVIRLSRKLGIVLPYNENRENLEYIQSNYNNDPRIEEVYNMIGVYLGYSLAYYYEFYGFENVLLFGRVLTGKGGTVIKTQALKILSEHFSRCSNINIILPDESDRRTGQSLAVALI
ncbi:ROK family protein [bacterium]|nr:ROK family protein [bacterium]